MNKKIMIAITLFITGNTNITNTYNLGVEMTWPYSSLLWVSDVPLKTMASNVKSHNQYYGDGGQVYGTGAIPQVNGYYATEKPFTIVLQRGANANNGGWDVLRHPNSYVANPIIYFSDVVRAFRNVETFTNQFRPRWKSPSGNCYSKKYKAWGPGKQINLWKNPHLYSWGTKSLNTFYLGGVPPVCSKGPDSSWARGQSSGHYFVGTFDQVVSSNASLSGGGHYSSTTGALKRANFGWDPDSGNYGNTTNPNKSLELSSKSCRPMNGQPLNYYFAETGVDIYLPIHMVSPGDNISDADQDYVNFGPAPNDYKTPHAAVPFNDSTPNDIRYTDKSYGNWLPWTYGYFPKNIPSDLAGDANF
jgi:hypothetical protein